MAKPKRNKKGRFVSTGRGKKKGKKSGHHAARGGKKKGPGKSKGRHSKRSAAAKKAYKKSGLYLFNQRRKGKKGKKAHHGTHKGKRGRQHVSKKEAQRLRLERRAAKARRAPKHHGRHHAAAPTYLETLRAKFNAKKAADESRAMERFN
jgi:hypothetical protein